MNNVDKLWNKNYQKEIVIRKSGSHNYIRREGGPGNYKYVYEEGHGGTSGSKPSGSNESGPVKPVGVAPKKVTPTPIAGQKPVAVTHGATHERHEEHGPKHTSKIEGAKKKYRDAMEMADHTREKKKQLSNDESAPRYDEAIKRYEQEGEDALLELKRLRLDINLL